MNPPIHHSRTALLEPLNALLTRRPSVHDIVAGTLILRHHSQTPEILLLRRIATDTFPLRWEYPGGTIDTAQDTNLLSTATRECHEETGLNVRKVIAPIVLSSFEAEVGEDEVKNVKVDEDLTCRLEWEDRVWGIAVFLVESGEGKVKLDQREHGEWRWVCEEEVLKRRFRDVDGIEGERIDFVSEAMRQVILEGFSIAKGL